jgi:iron complex outermembrane receptor protein
LGTVRVHKRKQDRYYDDYASKMTEIFCESQLPNANKLSLFGDLQLRNVHYKANGAETGMVNDNFNFFNQRRV